MSTLNKILQAVPNSEKFISYRELVHYLLDCVQKQETFFFEAFFDSVEKEIIFATPEDQQVLIVSLLEGLKNESVLRDIDYVIFENWLRPETHLAWRWLEKRWKGKSSLADTASGN